MVGEEWIKNTRLDYDSFIKLADIIRLQIQPDPESFRQDSISVEKRLAIVLYYLKDQGSFRMTANTFGISLASVSRSLRIVCNAINIELGSKLIKFPQTREELKVATDKFENKFGIPLAIGCIDGTHIPIQQPHENPHDYFCYKMKYSLNCQAICDEKGLFIDVEVKWPGIVHDARIYANCGINKLFTSKALPLTYQELVPGYAPVMPFLLGDPAYPLLPNVMKEYPTCTTNTQVLFNNMLRTARNQIECAFGRLKARWRILNRTMDVDLEFATSMIYTCFVLHNYCEINNVDIHNDLVQRALLSEQRIQCCDHHNRVDKLYSYNSSRGMHVRDSVAQYINDKK